VLVSAERGVAPTRGDRALEQPTQDLDRLVAALGI
jgi:hypothetical protein